MRILYITNGFPYPLTSGYLRHYFLIRELSQRHAVTLLSIVRDGFAAEHVRAMAPLTERVMTFAAGNGGGSRIPKIVRQVQTLTGRDPAVRQLCAAIARLTSEKSFDAALLSGKQTSAAMGVLNDLPVVVDLCDATSVRIRGTIRHARRRRLPRLLLSYLHVRRVERRLIRGARHLLFASARDREALMDARDRRATVIPNGVDLDYWRRSSPLRGRHTIIFTGGMDYPPNTDAALCLIEEILPLVRRQVPEAQLLIVGRDPTRRLIEAGRRPGVTVTGYVDDVRPYLQRATVFAAPLRFGAGIQNKLLEAMAMEVPVVASPLAGDGLRTAEGRRPPIQMAPDPRGFAELVARQLTDRPEDLSPHVEGRRFMEDHFVWKRSGENLERVIYLVANTVFLKG